MQTSATWPKKNIAFLCVAFILSIFLAYSNTFQSTWHFDDFGNIHDNQALHLTDIKPSSILRTFFANPILPETKAPYRPISNLTLALNWYWGGDLVWGYHLVNTGIHALAAIFLFLTILKIYDTPFLAKTDRNVAWATAILATFWWALNPVQTQAVTYIVQRMASLAGLFSIMTIYCYISTRLTKSLQKKLLLGCCTCLCTLLAIGAKENAAILPISIICSEFIFFNKKNYELKNYFFIFTCCAIFCLISYFFLDGKFSSIINGYKNRPFTLTERLLTEPRIIILYITLLFIPHNSYISLEHDIVVSKSLLDPWTTLPSIFLLMVTIYYSILISKKNQLLSYSILFFYINHIIESTIIPLELIFEHRNYIPSMFIFVPLSEYLIKLIIQNKISINIYLTSIIPVTITLLLGIGTYSRNTIWKDDESLWKDALSKAPNSARASYNLGNWLLATGRPTEALTLFHRAKTLSDTAPLPMHYRSLSLNGIGAAHLITNEQIKSINYFNDALTIFPNDRMALSNLTLAYIANHKWKLAQENIEKLLNIEKNNSDYIYMNAIINLNSGLFTQINNEIEIILRETPKSSNLELMLAASFKKTRQYENAIATLKNYKKKYGDNIILEISLYEIYEKQNDIKLKQTTIEKIINMKHDFKNIYNNNLIMGLELYSKNTIDKIFIKNEKI